MIVGRLADVEQQKGVLPAAIVRAIEVLQAQDLSRLEPGRREIDGNTLYYSVDDVVLRAFEESRTEAHAQYADIQMPLSGCERYGFSLPQPDLPVTDDQLEKRDVAFYPAPANESFMDLHPGTYVVFLPGELHRPCLAISGKPTLRKVVVKVHRSLLGL